MKRNDGKEFEGLVGKIYDLISSSRPCTSVEVDVKLVSKAGTSRQFDVVVREELNGSERLTVIEAKDWGRPVDVDIIDALAGKMRTVNAHNGIIVSRNGFRSGAITEAKYYGIEICTAHNIDNLAKLKVKPPVVIHFLPLNRLSFRVSMPATYKGGQYIEFENILVDGKPGIDLFREELFSGKLNPKIRRPLSDTELQMERSIEVGDKVIADDDYELPRNTWEPSKTSKVKYIDPKSGYTITVANFKIHYFLIYEYYFGYLTDLPNTIALDNISTSQADVFFNMSDIHDFQKLFRKFSSLEELAVTEAINYHFLGDIDMNHITDAMRHQERKT